MKRFYATYWLTKLIKEGKTYEDLLNKDTWKDCKEGDYDASKWAYEWFMKWSKEL